MDDFKKLPKMQHFKEGGHAKPKAMCYGGKAMKKGGEVDKADIEQDKKMIKKAFKQHDEAEHDKEPTEIKLRKGGRAKKETGTVKKFKTGGSVTNVYEAKKSSGDIDNIKKVKDIKPAKAAAPSKAATKPAFKGSDVAKEKNKPAGHKDSIKKVPPTGDKKAAAASGAKGGPNKYKTGGKVKKMADGGATMERMDLMDRNLNHFKRLQDAIRGGAASLRDNVIGTPAQNAIARANEAKYLRAKQLQQAAGVPMGGMEQAAMGLAGLGQSMQPAAGARLTNADLQQAQQAKGIQPAPMPAPVAQKRGGKAGKC